MNRPKSLIFVGLILSSTALFANIAPPPFIEDRGIILLVVDNTMATPLASELARLEKDLIGDGWQVIRYDAPRGAAKFFPINQWNATNKVWEGRDVGSTVWANVVSDPNIHVVKNWIKARYNENPTRVKSVFLFGHIPMPISGASERPDGHAEHGHPMATDAFYADMTDGIWTDSSNNPGFKSGDGIFDQVAAGGFFRVDTELEVGRVDLWNLPEFAKSETELLRQYLNKDHNYRYGITTTRNVAFHENNLPADKYLNYPTPPEALGYLMGGDVVNGSPTGLTLRNESKIDSYRLAFSGALGTWGSLRTNTMVADDPQINFLWLYGSYTWDWRHNQQTVPDGAPITTRAILCAPTYGLASFWNNSLNVTGLNQGKTFGSTTAGNFVKDRAYIAFSFNGDPSLRLHTAAPVSGVSATRNATGVSVAWTPPAGTTLGYKVYRAQNEKGPFQSINSDFHQETQLQDDAAPSGSSTVYMVRSVVKETTPEGEYLNPSQGVFATATNGIAYRPPLRPPLPDTGRGRPVPRPAINPQRSEIASAFIELDHAEHVTATVYNRFGDEVRVLANQELPSGIQNLEWDGRDSSGTAMPSGMYIVHVRKSKPERLKFVIVK